MGNSTDLSKGRSYLATQKKRELVERFTITTTTTNRPLKLDTTLQQLAINLEGHIDVLWRLLCPRLGKVLLLLTSSSNEISETNC